MDPPRPTPAKHHPSHLLDYYRFATDSVVNYNRIHTEILREHDDWFITHNFMVTSRRSICTKSARTSISSRETPTRRDSSRTDGRTTRRWTSPVWGDPDHVGMTHDLCRATNDAPFWVRKQQLGDVNWPPHYPQPAGGAMRVRGPWVT